MTSEKKPSAPTPGVNPTTFVEPIFQQLKAKHAHTSARSLCFKRLRSVRALVEKAAAAGEAGARDPWLLEKLRGGADDEEEEEEE